MAGASLAGVNLLPLHAFFVDFTKMQVRLRRAIVQTAEPLVQWHITFAEIHIVITVMQVVHVSVIADGFFITEDDFVKTGVTDSGAQSRLEGIEHHVQRVAGYDHMNQYTAEIQQVFHRVHGHAGPRANIHILVVQVVDAII